MIADIRTKHLPNTSLGFYRYVNPFRDTRRAMYLGPRVDSKGFESCFCRLETRRKCDGESEEPNCTDQHFNHFYLRPTLG
jgi:hypothetical protein